MTLYISEEVSLGVLTTSRSSCPKLPLQPQHPPTRQATTTLRIPPPIQLSLPTSSPPARPPIWRTCPPPPTRTCLPLHTLLIRQDILIFILIPLSSSTLFWTLPLSSAFFSHSYFEAFTVPQQQPWWPPRRHRRSESTFCQPSHSSLLD